MSSRERTGVRDLTYSIWHREHSLGRYFQDRRAAFICAMVDIDSLEYCRYCYEPLALIETAQGRRLTRPKDAAATSVLARRASVPAYSAQYTVDDGGGIAEIALRQIEPPHHGGDCDVLTPKAYADFLLGLRERHWSSCTKAPDALDWDANYRCGR